jgi:DNA-binding transcriptional LysR family regulator
MARNLNFQQIEAFKAVMQTGTTTRAAAMLNTTQPSISRRIAELQSATELTLFDLHQGRLRPTSEGNFLYKAIQQHFAGLQKIESIVAIMRESGTQTLRLGCTPTLGIGLLPEVVGEFLKKYPNTHISIQTMSTHQLEGFLNQDLIDLALATGEFNHSDFQPVVIKTTPAVCVLPLNHPLKDADTIELSMLKGERILSISETDELCMKIKEQLLKHGMPDYLSVQTTSSITVCALVAAGIGVGIVTPYIANTFLGQLLIKPLKPSIAIDLQMATSVNTAPSLLTRYFISLLLKKTNASGEKAASV